MLAPILLATVFSLVMAVFVPNVGLLAQWGRYRRGQRRIRVEDALKHIHACEWRGHTATLESVAGALRISSAAVARLLERMETDGLVHSAGDGLRLTPSGEQLALAVVRAHRLWERYLADEARMPLTQIHAEAEQREHNHTRESLLALETSLGYPRLDPHGDPIPSADGKFEPVAAQPLTNLALNTPARISHIEDEPDTIFAQIIAQGLRLGQHVRVVEMNAQRVVISDGERTHTLAPIVAANIFATAYRNGGLALATSRLAGLRPGQAARVQGLDENLRGFTRRRLLDLGLTPGATIAAELPNMFGDPVAYRVRGALIALRREQAEQVLIETQG